ncbi:hypothetical protein TTSV1_gp21 [Thermoproteus tenax spherical virus 1]|uniref:Uncharacterized protein n=1 Tax=Thermoproteus tenax spherical virus 1 TaxID=292639 RepID=Q647E1_9VIRU|nr:hypothetical protein TTSV1_gp21 [Thermoproteus tenax spherical virus 1]AAU25971.1 hypothetical protein [Thermoproteus tenax spherical virus 1]
MSYIPDLSRFGVLGILALFVPSFVYGAMTMYLGVANGWLFLIQLLALIAIIAHYKNFSEAVLFALGAAFGGLTTQFIGIKWLVVDALSPALYVLLSMVNTIEKAFYLGIALGMVGFLLAPIVFIVTTLVSLAAMLILRLSGLLYEAVNLVVHGLRHVPEGYRALLAPWIGSVMIALPIAVLGGMFLSALALVVGAVVGGALVGMLGTASEVSALAGFIIPTLLTRPQTKTIAEVLMDMGALFLGVMLVGYGVVQVLWTAGYAAISTRHASRGFYLIGLSAITAVLIGAAH